MRGNHINDLWYTRNQVHDFLALLGLRVIVGLVLWYVTWILLLMLRGRKLGNVVFDAVRRNLKSIFARLLLICRRKLLLMRLRIIGLDIPSFESRITAYGSINGRNVDYPRVWHPPMNHKAFPRPVAIALIFKQVWMTDDAAHHIKLLVHHC